MTTRHRCALGAATIWSDVSLTIEQGEFVAILGPNGAGKSNEQQLLQVLLGLIPLSAGVTASVARLRAPESETGRSATLPQRHGFDAATRIRGVDMVRLGLDGDRFGLPLRGRRAARERVTEVVDLVGARSYAGRAIGECSGGEQQRLLIAQALVAAPEMLFLDEPLDSLDLPNQAAVSALLGRICRSQGVAVLLVAHDAPTRCRSRSSTGSSTSPAGASSPAHPRRSSRARP